MTCRIYQRRLLSLLTVMFWSLTFGLVKPFVFGWTTKTFKSSSSEGATTTGRRNIFYQPSSIYMPNRREIYDHRQQQHPWQLFSSSTSSTSSTSASSSTLSYDGKLSEHTFADLYSEYFPSWLIDRLHVCGWEYPTLIQERALNIMLFGEQEQDDGEDDDEEEDQDDEEDHLQDDDDLVNDNETVISHEEEEAKENVIRNGNLEIRTNPSSSTTTTILPPNSVVIQAQTGSGKTLTYLLPLLAEIDSSRNAIQAMIVVPTRELGLQVAKVAKRLAYGAPDDKILIMSLLQGSTLKRQRAWAWAETPQIVIGTPCELLDMIQYGGLPRINSIRYVVVDEVDACLVHQYSSSSSSSLALLSGGGGNTKKKGADRDNKIMASALHVLLSKHLSPTYSVDDGTMFLDDPNMAVLGQGGGAGTTTSKRPRQFQSQRRTIFASATIPQHRHFLKQCQANQWTLEKPIFVCTSPGEVMPPTLKHGYLVCTKVDQKVASLRRILKKLVGSSNTADPLSHTTSTQQQRKILIFCDMIRPMEEMARVIAHDFGGIYFQEDGKTQQRWMEDNDDHDGTIQLRPIVSVLRGDESLSHRAGATDAFRSEVHPLTILITGDVAAARGLDIMGVTHVIHFDLPPNADTYLHRSGRAGRFGRKGQVLSIITPEQEFVLERFMNVLQLSDRLVCIGRQKTRTTTTTTKGVVEQQ